MLLEFRVGNFRSFRDEAVLSLVASSDKSLPENLIETGITAAPRALRSVGVYGANASGKSNLVAALAFMRDMVLRSAQFTAGAPLPAPTFRLDDKMKDKPTSFEATFVKGGVRYQYGFTMRADRFLDEWLLAYRTRQPQTWFSREFDQGGSGETFKFGPHMRGARELWREATKANSLYISTAVQLNSEQLRPVFEWFSDDLVVWGASDLPNYINTLDYISRNGGSDVLDLLVAADTGINNISQKTKKGSSIFWQIDRLTGETKTGIEDKDIQIPEFIRVSGDQAVRFDLADESDGTQKLFAIAGPLLAILAHGHVLVVDELDRSMHALLVRRIIQAFQRPSNPHNAQLIFTTHDTSLLSGDLLRRDQIWLVEKAADHASRLFPLTDFSPRKGEAIERRYLQGRFGAVPILGPLTPVE